MPLPYALLCASFSASQSKTAFIYESAQALEHVYLGGSLTAVPDIQPLACLPLNLSCECPTKMSIRELRVQLMKEVVEARKIKEKKLGTADAMVVKYSSGCMVKSPREAGLGQGEGADKQMPSWPTVTATDSLSWNDEAWAEVEEERRAKMAHEQPPQEKKGFWRWLCVNPVTLPIKLTHSVPSSLSSFGGVGGCYPPRLHHQLDLDSNDTGLLTREGRQLLLLYYCSSYH